MAERCIWTGRRSNRTVAVEIPGVDRLGRARPPMTVHVLPEHERDVVDYATRVRQHGTRFLVAVVAIGVLMLVASFLPVLDEAWTRPATVIIGILVALMGAIVIVFPFVTPETVAFFGIARSVILARSLGVLMLVLGAGIVVFG